MSVALETGRARPGLPQGLVLVALACVSTVAAVVIAPVLPTMAQIFQKVPGVELKIPLVATGPSLLVSVLAIPCGFLSDRVGRRTLLLCALALYGIAGMAPLLLTDLNLIVSSRLVVGLAEAAIITCGTALIGDYYEGRQRQRWLAAQAGTASLSAVVLVFIGGMLGTFGWHTPFFVYGWGFVLIPLVLLFVWEPRHDPAALGSVTRDGVLVPFNWLKPVSIAAVIMLSMIAFMVTVVQFGFLITERGIASPQAIGLWSALVTTGNPLGAVAFSVMKRRTAVKLSVSYALFAGGFSGISLIPTPEAAIIGSFVANLGAGFILPTATTWLLSTMPTQLLGRGSGLLTSAVFLGQFLGPFAILALGRATGSLSNAILCMSVVCAVAAMIAAGSMLLGPQTKQAVIL